MPPWISQPCLRSLRCLEAPALFGWILRFRPLQLQWLGLPRFERACDGTARILACAAPWRLSCLFEPQSELLSRSAAETAPRMGLSSAPPRRSNSRMAPLRHSQSPRALFAGGY